MNKSNSKTTFKKLLVIVGISTLIANSIVLYITWIVAFLNDSSTVITINNHNEMYIEFFFIPITIGIGIWSIWFLLRTYTKTTKTI